MTKLTTEGSTVTLAKARLGVWVGTTGILRPTQNNFRTG